MELAIQQKQQQSAIAIPSYLENLVAIFSKKKSTQLLMSQPYDMTIQLKDDFVLKLAPVFQLTIDEDIQLQKFLKENLVKGYIQPSTSPQAAGFFFIKKTASYIQCRIIGTSIHLPFEMPIPCY